MLRVFGHLCTLHAFFDHKQRTCTALENLSYLERKGAPIILKYKTLAGKREFGRLRNSNLPHLGVSQWQTQQLICASAKNYLLIIVTVQGVQRCNPAGVGTHVELPSTLQASSSQATMQQEHRRRSGRRLDRFSFSFTTDCHVAVPLQAKRNSSALIFNITVF